ncbi:MAG: alkaline phosphatase family protein [Saprospiraceae bacterium]
MYLRLDITIGEFLDFLDKKVGKGNYLLFLTADHACGENPNFLNDHKMHVKNLDRNEVKNRIIEISENLYGVDLIENYDNQNIHFNLSKIDSLGLNKEEVYNNFQEKLQELEFVKHAFTEEELMNCSPDFLQQEWLMDLILSKMGSSAVV